MCSKYIIALSSSVDIDATRLSCFECRESKGMCVVLAEIMSSDRKWNGTKTNILSLHCNVCVCTDYLYFSNAKVYIPHDTQDA